jgi:TolB-like protein/DNA-binding winged helix-turn-helix (wHTH) protein
MTGSQQPLGMWRFGPFEMDVATGELRKCGVRIRLQGQPFHVLTVLLARAGELVTREELRREVWPENTFVEFDHALNTAIKKIRVALCDDACTPRYVETIPRRGYRFIADARPLTERPRQTAIHILSGGLRRKRRFPLPSAAGLVLTLAGLALFAAHAALRARSPRNPSSKPIVLAVLPFEDWSDDPAQGYLSEGITQEMISQFGRSDSRLVVAPLTSAQQYRKTTKSVALIGSELRADYLMNGSIRRDGRHMRVSAELVRVQDQARIWGADFDREDLHDLLAAEKEVARLIAAEVQSEVFAPPAR